MSLRLVLWQQGRRQFCKVPVLRNGKERLVRPCTPREKKLKVLQRMPNHGQEERRVSDDFADEASGAYDAHVRARMQRSRSRRTS